MRLLGAHLANTASGSFLVSKAQVTFDEIKQIVVPPVLEHVPKSLMMPDWGILSQSELLSSYSHNELEERCAALSTNLQHAQSVI